MNRDQSFRWTNKSVLQLAGKDDPITVIERKARDLVLQARDQGWMGPPFNPIFLADLLGITVNANADIADARIVSEGDKLQIQFNPTQLRERVRFSIAHEIAHSLFPDVGEEIRNRGGRRKGDDWQLEILCNLAAAEFVMPIGSLSARERLPSLEDLMVERRQFDVSAEAFLIRVAKIATEPVVMFCASIDASSGENNHYRIDYAVASATAPQVPISGLKIPKESAVYNCTAIGFTSRGVEQWFSEKKTNVECVGIPGYPGSSAPRVAGLIRFSKAATTNAKLSYVHGDVLKPRGTDTKVICQLVNNQARVWGGGVARSTAKLFPNAQREFSSWIVSIPRPERLGRVHFAQGGENIFVASLIGQEGFGPSDTPRIRYAALERCFGEISEFASKKSASVHMPRLGAGESGGSWDTVQEIVQDALVTDGIPVTVYDLPPKRLATSPGLFD